MSDGVTPSNEGRGYILRRLLRRTVRAMRLLGVDTRDLPRAVHRLARRDEGRVPRGRRPTSTRISRLAYAEEETFLRTLASGTTILDLAVANTQRAGKAQLAGDTAFLLHDTYGFPIDLTLEMAEEAGLTVDRDAFDSLMAEQRAAREGRCEGEEDARWPTSRSTARSARSARPCSPATTSCETESRVLGLIVDGASVTNGDRGPDRRGHPRRDLALRRVRRPGRRRGHDRRPRLRARGARRAEARSRASSATRCRSAAARSASATPATSVVDRDYRRGARQAHSGTHLIHAALRQVLGPNAHQSGSYNKAGYLRLDFSLEPGALARDAQRDRGDLEQRHPRQPRGRHARDAARRGQGARRDGAVRREVRRHRARGRHRRPVVARALRGHPRDARAPRSA